MLFMHNKLLRFLFLSTFAFFTFICSIKAQTNQRATLDSIAGRLMRQVLSNQDDRIILHHDKPYYLSGTNIWFRAYILKDLSGQVSPNRNNIYVTLTNINDSIVSQTVLNSGERAWDGSLPIPARATEGFYTLRAFTQEMAALGSDKNFSEQVYILNTNSGIKSPVLPGGNLLNVKEDPILHFYPEGGSLVNGIDNLIGFEARGMSGNPVVVEGMVIDDNKKLVARFKSDPAGKGTFIFNPFKNRTYTSVVKNATGAELKFPLPTINYKASQLNMVSQNDKNIRLRVVLGDSIYAKKPVSYILGVSKDKLCFAGIGNGMFETDVSLAGFPSGPATFYVFDENQVKQSERRVFIDKKNIKVIIQVDKENYAARQKANIGVQVSDLDGKPLPTIFSVSVTDDRFVGFPFLSSGEGKRIARDTVGLLKNAQVEIQSLTKSSDGGDSGIILSGVIRDRNGSVKEGQVITIFTEGTNLVLTDTSDAQGKFSFPPFDFTDQTPFFSQVTDLKGVKQDVLVTTDPLPFSLPKGENFEPDHWTSVPSEIQKFKQMQADSLLTGTYKNQLDVIAAKEAGTTKKGKSKVAERSASSHMITGEQLDKLELGNVVNAVKMLPGIIMVGDKLTIRGGTQSVGANSSDIEPLVLVDGVPAVSSNVAAFLNSLPPQSIEYIEVITGGEAARYGTRAANGVILIKSANTLRPMAGPGQKGIQYIFPVGYHKKQPFYIPPYDSYGVREESFTDNRSTIYWNGEIVTDASGKAAFWFYTADLPASYTIRIKGVTSKGDFIDESQTINRK